MKKYTKALEDLDKAIQMGTNDGEVYHSRGKCHQAFGETAKAEADFAKARELGFKE